MASQPDPPPTSPSSPSSPSAAAELAEPTDTKAVRIALNLTFPVLLVAAALYVVIYLLPAIAVVTQPSTPTTPPAASPTASTNTALPAPSPVPDAAAINAALAGLTVEAAEKKASNAGYTTRIVSEDGVPLPATMDYSTSRINFETVDGVVTRATVG